MLKCCNNVNRQVFLTDGLISFRIDHWDAEKERLMMLTDHSLLIIKYDFITLTVADYRRLLLKDFDRIIIGGFMYPGASVVP